MTFRWFWQRPHTQTALHFTSQIIYKQHNKLFEQNKLHKQSTTNCTNKATGTQKQSTNQLKGATPQNKRSKQTNNCKTTQSTGSQMTAFQLCSKAAHVRSRAQAQTLNTQHTYKKRTSARANTKKQHDSEPSTHRSTHLHKCSIQMHNRL